MSEHVEPSEEDFELTPEEVAQVAGAVEKIEEAVLTVLVKASTAHKRALAKFKRMRIAYLEGVKFLRPDEQAELDLLHAMDSLNKAEQMYNATVKELPDVTAHQSSKQTRTED